MGAGGITTSVSTGAATVATGDIATVTVTFTNTEAGAASLTSATVTLPDGFRLVRNSTKLNGSFGGAEPFTGATGALTWPGSAGAPWPIAIPGNGGTLTLSFELAAPSAAVSGAVVSATGTEASSTTVSIGNAAIDAVATVPGTLVLTPEADTYVDASNPLATTNGLLDFFDSYGNNIGQPGPQYGLLRFDLAALPAGATVTDAKLKLSSFSGFSYDGDVAQFAIFLANDTWPESVDYANRPDDGQGSFPDIRETPLNLGYDPIFYGGTYGVFEHTHRLPGPSNDRPYTPTMTQTVAQEAAGDRKISMEIFNPPGGPDGYWVRFSSKEAGDPNVRPQLIVTYTIPVVPTFTVNSAADPGTGVCDVDECTLREAIDAANAQDGANTIDFSVPAVTLSSTDLPEVTDQVTIDGGTSPPTIDGAALAGASGPMGLHLAAGSDGSVIKHLGITGVPGTAIVVESSSSTVDGNELTGNGAGILVTGAAPASVVDPFVPDNVTVRNNSIAPGLTPPAATADAALTVVNSSHVDISDNTITGYDGAGISATGTYRLFLADNAIGTNPAGTADLGNTGNGIVLDSLSQFDPEGGVAQLAANTVAHNGGKGVVIVGATSRSSLSGNRIFANDGQSIDIGDDGPDGTSPGGTVRPNAGQHRVTLTSAVVIEGVTHVAGDYISPGTHNYAIEIFAGSNGGSAEAELWLGTGFLNTDGDGPHSFDVSVGAAPPGSYITATITPETHSTSELSNAVLATAGSAAFVVDSTADFGDESPVDGVCKTDVGSNCTLRAAIEEANAHPNAGTPDRIEFDIPEGGAQTITPDLELPAITDPVVIDGTTQPGYATVPLIFVDGSAASCGECGVDGLVVDAGGSGSEIRGLAIGNFDGNGIVLSGNDAGSVVESSWIGIKPPGPTSSAGNRANGIRISNSSGNRIGGPLAAQRVVLGANGNFSGTAQIAITGFSSGNTVEGSYIGLGPDGSFSYDTENGILITGAAANNTIGGDSGLGEGNILYGFYGTAVVIDGAGAGNEVAGNTIGADAFGNTTESPSVGVRVNNTSGTVIGDDVLLPAAANMARGNVIVGSDAGGGVGISTGGTSTGTKIAGNFVGVARTGNATNLGNDTGIMVSGASDNQVGPGNHVAHNTANGIEIDGESAGGNRIVANSIHDNGGKGIALLSGANNGLAAPELDFAALANTTTTVQGSISVPPGTTYFVEFFASPSCDPSGAGEGEAYRGFESVVAPAGEQPTVVVPFSGEIGAVAAGSVVTATVTRAVILNTDTSEFSSCVTVGTTVVDSVAIEAGVGSVKAPGSVPLANVPPAAFLTNTASSQRSSPVNDVPVNDILLRGSPVNDIPVNDVGLDALAPQLGDVLLSTVPLLRPGGWEAALAGTALAGRPLQNVTLRDVFELIPVPAFLATLDLGELDLSNSPLGKIPAFAWAVGEVPLSQLGIQGTTWCEVFAGPPVKCAPPTEAAVEARTLLSLGLSGAPVNDVPVNDVPVNEIPVNDIPVNDVPVNDIRVDGVPVNDVPINDVPVNDVPVNDIPVNDVPVNDVRVMNNPVNEIPVNEIPVNDVPVNDVPVNEIPVNDVPVNEIPVNDVPVNEIPVNDIPVNEILLNGSPVNDIPVNDIANKAAIFKCVPTCPASGTLGQNAAELKSGVTLLDLRLAHVGGDLPAHITLGDIGSWDTATVGDLVSALGGVDWRFLPPGTNPPSLAQIVGLVKQYAGTTPAAPTLGDLLALIALTRPSLAIDLAYVTQTLYGNGASLAQMLALVLSSSDLGWERLDLNGLGIGQYADGADTVPYSVDVAISGGGGEHDVTVRVTLPPGFSYVSGSSRLEQDEATATVPDPTEAGGVLTWTLGIASPGSAQLRFSANPGTVLGPASATAKARAAGSPTVAAPDPATVDVTESFPGASTATPAAITSDAFYLTYISSSADGDVFSLPAPPIGSRVTIHLSHLPVDYDLVVYGPRGQVLVDPSASAVPLDGQQADPVGAPTHAIDELPADAVDGVPIQAGATVVGISANRTSQQDDVTFVSAGTGTYLIQVSGFNGAVGIEPAMVRAEVLPPRTPATCTVRSFDHTALPASSLTTAAVPAGVNTVFVVNRQQLARVYGAATADHAISTLTGFAVLGYPGAVLQVDSDPAVRAAYDGAAGWNDCPADPVRANTAAAAVGAVVRNFRSSHQTVANVILVGSDDVLPFARLDDRVTLSNESAYTGTFPADSPLGGALGQAAMLSDDPYVTLNPIPFFDRQLYLPELAVGRLIETPAQIEAQVAAFAAAGGSLDPHTAFTSGYSFLTDGAEAVSSALTPVAGVPSVGGTNDTLISETWTAGQLRAKLETPASILSINAHADHSRFQAANGTLLASDTLAPTSSFNGRILFSMGCHAGLNVPDPFLAGTRGLGDWPQTFQGLGAAVFIGNSGFGYGDSDIAAYSEDLNARFAEHLAEGFEAGQALTLAKQEFKSELGIVGVYDEKAMVELTLYGMPMYRIGRLTPPAAATASAKATGARVLSAGSTGAGLSTAAAAAGLLTTSVDPVTGLVVESFAVDQNFTGRRVDRLRGSFYRGRNGVYITHLRPLEPKAVEPIASPNAHGALITELTSNDVSPFDPLFQRPTVDGSATEPELAYDAGAFPSKLQTVTTFEGRSGRRHKLVLAQGRFFAVDGSDGDERGVQRLFTHIAGHVFTSAGTDYAPPLVRSVDAVKTGGFLNFTADVDAGAGDSVKRVLVLFLDGPSGAWTPLDLQLVGGHWSGAAATVAPTSEYFVQAVDARGNVTVSTNKGFYYAGAAVPPQTGEIIITPTGTASGGTFTGPVTVTTTAPPGVTVQVSVDGGPFTTTPGPVTGDGIHVVKANGSNGSSSTTAFVIDATRPVITIIAPVASSSHARDAVVEADYECTDGPRPGPTCVGVVTGPSGAVTVPDGTALPTAQTGTYLLTVTSTDAAGNTQTGTAAYTIGTLAGTIAFVRGGKIWVVKPDGTDAFAPRQLTQLAGLDQPGAWIDEQPSVSPDGLRVLFARRAGASAKPQLWVIDAAGRNPTQLISDPTKDYTAPDWAPDGAQIAFESTRSKSKERDIWTATFSPTGTALTSFVDVSNAKEDDITPAWSPDGTRIAFASNRGAKFEIFTMMATGGKQTQLTKNKKNDVDPSYSPSGQKITFSSNQGTRGPANKQEIFVMNASNGGSQLRLTTIMGFDRAPLYLDAGRIVFQSATFAGGGLAIVAPTGGTVAKIAGTSPNDATPG